MIENWKKIDPMGLSASLVNYKKTNTTQKCKGHQQPSDKAQNISTNLTNTTLCPLG